MLRRMYENVQEPLLNATTLSGYTRNDVGSNQFAALLGAQGGGQGRHQSNNPPTSGSETTNNSPASNTNPLPNPWASVGSCAATPRSPKRSLDGNHYADHEYSLNVSLGFITVFSLMLN